MKKTRIDYGIVKNNGFQRNYGIDCLRIVSMIMILILHILGQGGVISSTVPNSFNYWLAWLLETAAYCAVNCYALISGYVGYKSKSKPSSLIQLLFKVLFYIITTTLIFSPFAPRNFSVGSLLRIFIPFGFGNNAYWYFTAYFCLFIFQPYLNILIEHLNRKQHKSLVIASVVMFSVLPLLLNMDLFNTLGGYSVIWLVQLYIIGSFIGKYNIKSHKKTSYWCLIYIVSVFCGWGLKLVFASNELVFINKLYSSENFVTYTSPFILLSGISLLMMFSRIQFNKLFCKIISFFTPMSFSVYLIHCAPLIWNFWLPNRFSYISEKSGVLLIAFTVGIAVLIWFVASLIDLIRIYLFKWFRVNKLSIYLEHIIFKITNRFF